MARQKPKEVVAPCPQTYQEQVESKMEYSDIRRLIPSGNYAVHVPWAHLQESLKDYIDGHKADLNPDFQRGHVWTPTQQKAYVEYKLSGGEGSDRILWNCPGWMYDFRGPLELVDGKQRMRAVLLFLNNRLPAFGHYCKEYVGRMPHYACFVFSINNLPTRKMVLEWYLQLNGGGTPHTKEELNRVKALLNLEVKNEQG